MSDVLEITARIHFRGAEDGGRETPVFSGYRPALYFGGKQIDGAVILEGSDEKLMPGEEREVRITLLHPENAGIEPKRSEPFEVREGTRVVGEGRVLSILPAGKSSVIR